ncbi:MAG TPA: GerMN domain-containing protein [Candidatus Paceibacterota bacterium]|jgi:hypothetical protein
MNKTLQILAAALVVLIAFFYVSAKRTQVPYVPLVPTEVSQTTLTLYAYDARRDMDDVGNVLCSSKGLVPITRTVPTTETPLKDALTLLFAGGLTEDERARGLTTEFPLQGVRLESVAIRGDEATIELADPNHASSGGSCRIGILRAQVEATAKQFPDITHVRFTPEGVLEP